MRAILHATHWTSGYCAHIVKVMANLTLLVLIQLALLAIAASDELDDRREDEFMAYLELESLLSRVAEGASESIFLEHSASELMDQLETLTKQRAGPESSSASSARAVSLHLGQQLVSAYHKAALGECDSLGQETWAIGSQLLRISQSFDVYLPSLNKYLAALTSQCRPKETQHEEQGQWGSEGQKSLLQRAMDWLKSIF